MLTLKEQVALHTDHIKTLSEDWSELDTCMRELKNEFITVKLRIAGVKAAQDMHLHLYDALDSKMEALKCQFKLLEARENGPPPLQRQNNVKPRAEGRLQGINLERRLNGAAPIAVPVYQAYGNIADNAQ